MGSIGKIFRGQALLPISFFITVKLLEFWIAGGAETNGVGTGNGKQPGGHDTGNPEHHKVPIERYEIAGINFRHVEQAFMISAWMLLACLAKIGFYLSPKPSAYVPESCMLIILGIICGMIIYFARIKVNYQLSTSLFFLVLLPPIALDAGYFMPLRPFFENIGTILILAIVGTLWNTLALGFSLWGIAQAGLVGWDVPIMHCLLFASLISAVDPVAVLAVFEEAHVNEVLHIIVFGESLLNDGVAIVLYNMFGAFSEIGKENIIKRDIIYGVISFFVVAFGGTLIGFVFGLFTGWLTKYTEKVKVIEPLFVFLLAYLSYLVADMFKLSGILAIVFCGIIMRRFVESNVAPKSSVTIKYTMKMLSNICESIIFLFLGLSVVNDTHIWNWAFSMFTLVFCQLYRTMGIMALIPLANTHRLVKLSKTDMFIMVYGGLRGAISFSLALLLDEQVIGVRNKRMFVTTTTFIVFFTSFIQGVTIRPMVEWLKVEKAQKKEINMGVILFTRVLQHLMAGVEDVIGWQGKNRLRDKIDVFQYRYLQPILLKNVFTRENRLLKICTKLNMDEASDLVKKYGGDVKALKEDIGSAKKEERPSIELPVVDTTHLDKAYSRRVSRNWHMIMDDITAKRRPTVHSFNRVTLDDEDAPGPLAHHSDRLYMANPSMITGKMGTRQPINAMKNTLRRYSTKLTNLLPGLKSYETDEFQSMPPTMGNGRLGVPNVAFRIGPDFIQERPNGSLPPTPRSQELSTDPRYFAQTVPNIPSIQINDGEMDSEYPRSDDQYLSEVEKSLPWKRARGSIPRVMINAPGPGENYAPPPSPIGGGWPSAGQITEANRGIGHTNQGFMQQDATVKKRNNTQGTEDQRSDADDQNTNF